MLDQFGVAHGQRHGGWENDEHIAQNGRHLRAHQVGHFIDKLLNRVVGLDVLELGGHGGGRHCRLLGRHGEVQHLDEHKADRIVHACGQARPEDGQPQRIQRKLGQRGESHYKAAASGLGHHVAVLALVAGDVVLARLGAALGHLGGQQRGIGGQQGAHAAAFQPHGNQIGQHFRSFVGAVVGQQAVQQAANAQDASTHLTQAEDQADGDAFGLDIGVDRRDGRAAGFESFAQLRRCGIAPIGGAQRQHDFHAQVFHVVNQGVKRLFFARLVAHAHAQLRREAGGQDLA